MERLFFLLFIFSTGCQCDKKGFRVTRTEGVTVRYNVPVSYDSSGNAIEFDHPYATIYRKGDFFLYETPSTFTEIQDGALIRKEARKYIYVYQKDNAYGVFINKWEKSENRRLKVDSFLNSDTYSTLNVYKNLKRVNFLLLNSNIDVEKKEAVLNYKMISKKDSLDCTIGSFYFTQRKIAEIEYSFSSELDTMKNYRLYKIVLKPQLNSIPTGMKSIPKVIISVELGNAVVDENEITEYLSLYKDVMSKTER